MSVEHLVAMANDIANFFAAEPDRAVAVDSVANHLKKFWAPRMRMTIVAHARENHAEGLSDLARDAVQKLAIMDAAPKIAST